MLKNKKGAYFQSLIIIAIIILILAFIFGWFKKASILGEGGNIGERRYISFVSEDNEKIIFDVSINADVPSTICQQKISTNIDTDWQKMLGRGDYDNWRRIDGLWNPRDYYSLTTETSELEITGISAIKDPCGVSSQANAYIQNKKVICKIIHETNYYDVIKCRFTADVITDNPPALFYGDILMKARITFYKAGYQPPQIQEQQIITQEQIQQEQISSVSTSLKPFSLLEWLSNLWNKILGWFKT